MSHEFSPDPGAQQIETRLSAYAPRPPRIDRDRLMFEAGRAAAFSHFPLGKGSPFQRGAIGWFNLPAAGSPPHWLWPASTLMMTAVSCGLAVALFLQVDPVPRVQVIKRVVREPHHAPSSTPAAPQPVLVSSDRRHQVEPLPAEPLPAEESPALTLAALPENHLLRVRQVALTQGADAISPPQAGGTVRLATPPTRGSLMRKFAPSPAAASSSPALFRWSLWSSAE